MHAVPTRALLGADKPGTNMQSKAVDNAAAGRPRAATWGAGAIPVALSLLVMLARRHHRLQPHHYTS